MFDKLKKKLDTKIKAFKAEMDACEKELEDYNNNLPSKYIMGVEKYYTATDVEDILTDYIIKQIGYNKIDATQEAKDYIRENL